MSTTKKECKVIMLPNEGQSVPKGNTFINKPLWDKGKLHIEKCERVTQHGHSWSGSGIKTDIQHLYIVSDDEIKGGDWSIDKDNNLAQCFGYLGRCKEEGIRKVIATTNGNIKMFTGIKNLDTAPSYPQPPLPFIEKFIEAYNSGNVITDVLVEYTEVLLPNEEGIPNCFEIEIPKVNSQDNIITITKVKDSYSREEVIQLLKYYRRYLDEYPSAKTSVNRMDKWIEENL